MGQQGREDWAGDKGQKMRKGDAGLKTKEQRAGGAVLQTLAYGGEGRLPRREEIERCRLAILRACWANAAQCKNVELFFTLVVNGARTAPDQALAARALLPLRRLLSNLSLLPTLSLPTRAVATCRLPPPSAPVPPRPPPHIGVALPRIS